MVRVCQLSFTILLFQFSVVKAQPLTWTNVTHVIVSGNYLEKVANIQTAWNAGAISKENFYGDGWVEFRFPSPKYAMMGLAPYNTAVNVSTIHYAIHAHINTYVQIFEKGLLLPNVGKGKAIQVTYTANDIFRVERKNGIVYYKKNGTTFYTSTIPSSGAVHVDAAFNMARAGVAVTDYMMGMVWTGAQNENWNEPENWNLNRVPTSTDQVTINACTVCPKLTNSVNVSALQLNEGSALHLENHVLAAGEAVIITTSRVTSTRGKIQSKDFAEIKNSIFSGSIVLEKTGGNSNACYGGNTFSPEVKIVNSSNSSWTVTAQSDNQVKSF